MNQNIIRKLIKEELNNIKKEKSIKQLEYVLKNLFNYKETKKYLQSIQTECKNDIEIIGDVDKANIQFDKLSETLTTLLNTLKRKEK